MTESEGQLDLDAFSFGSLYFCDRRPEFLRPGQFVTAVNEWYMPIIAAGAAVPLAFVLDLATILLRPAISSRFRWKQADLPIEINRLSLEYYRTLEFIRRQPLVEELQELLRGVDDETAQFQVVSSVVQYVFGGLEGVRKAYSFRSRDLQLANARIGTAGVAYVRAGKGSNATKAPQEIFHYEPLSKIADLPETFANMELLQQICDFYHEHPLEKVISEVPRIMVEIAASTAAGVGRADYRFLQFLLRREELEDVEEETPQPDFVDEQKPTNEYAVDGPSGGYIDITQKRFSGSVADVLPTEFAWPSETQMFHKWLNEGILSYVREDIEHVEEELRVLCCFVVDCSNAMLHTLPRAAGDLGRGLTTYMRARALMTVMFQDLVRFLPRKDIEMEFALYLWHPEAAATYRNELQLHECPREAAESRRTFVRFLASKLPAVFYTQPMRTDTPQFVALETSPVSFVVERSGRSRYHCRHVAFFTSRRSADSLLVDELSLDISASGRDSLHVITCDLEDQAYRLTCPARLDEAADDIRHQRTGELSEERLRAHFMEMVMLKCAGRAHHPEFTELLDDIL